MHVAYLSSIIRNLAGLRRHLNMTASMACLLDRMPRVREDHQLGLGEEERIGAERKACWHSYARRIGASRGQFVYQSFIIFL